MHKTTDKDRVKIGKLVRSFIPDIIAMCEKTDGELERLMKPKYTKRKFGIACELGPSKFPLSFCVEASKIPSEYGKDNQSKFYSKLYSVRGKVVRVTNYWYEQESGKNYRPNFLKYLIEKEIVDAEKAEELK